MAIELSAATVAYLSIASTVVGTAASFYATDQSKKAAEAEASYRQSLLKNQRVEEKTTLKENTRRRLQERDRQLSELRVLQASRGFAPSGTQLAVLGETQNRMDEEIDDLTNQGMGRIRQYGEQIRMSKFGAAQASQAADIQQFSNLLGGVTSGASSYASNYRNYGEGADVFNIFK